MKLDRAGLHVSVPVGARRGGAGWGEERQGEVRRGGAGRGAARKTMRARPYLSHYSLEEDK